MQTHNRKLSKEFDRKFDIKSWRMYFIKLVNIIKIWLLLF